MLKNKLMKRDLRFPRLLMLLDSTVYNMDMAAKLCAGEFGSEFFGVSRVF
jgi:hypothetical protein